MRRALALPVRPLLARPALRSALRLAPVALRRSLATTAAATANPAKKDMFCMQCEQTQDNTGCTKIGVCGKTPETAALQDLLLQLVKGISQYASRAAALGPQYRLPEVDRFVLHAIFATVTNVNFDSARFVEYMRKASAFRDQAKALYEKACEETKTKPEAVEGPALTRLSEGDYSEAKLHAIGRNYGVEARREVSHPDVVGLQEMIMYGIKGTCAYAYHALGQGEEDPTIYKDIHECLSIISNPNASQEQLWGTALKVGEINLRVMHILDKGHTTRFGNPVPTEVRTTPVAGKALLVSGHDLHDLEEILKQTEGTGVNVYTHGEMLPAHGYPGLKKYKHLAGHFGGPWQLQKAEFASFPGSIVMTTNCLVEPRKSYKHRIFTRSVTGWPGVVHIEGQNYGPAIAAAQKEAGFTGKERETKPLMTGFGHNSILSVADKVLDGVKSGAIKDFFVIGGCDGSEGERSYFTDVAKSTPKDSIILTLGCGKYRFNRLDLGDIGGIPRVLDMGQCNDAYSGIQVAVALAKALNTDVNSLPLHFVVSWFEQKAVAVFLTLLHLNIQNIRLGPNLPAFVTPNMMKFIQERFKLKGTGKPEEDLKDMLAGH